MNLKPSLTLFSMFIVLGFSWLVFNTLLKVTPPKQQEISISLTPMAEDSVSSAISKSLIPTPAVDDVLSSLVTKPVKSLPQNASTSISSEEFVERKRRAIWQDHHGNFRSEVYIEDRSQWQQIISDGPLFYPNQGQLLESLQGCSAAGYYVDGQTTVALIDRHGDIVRVFYYLCSVVETTGDYIFLEVQAVDHLMESVEVNYLE
ncbi:hypothetical protein QWI17_08570 [Gilvimarinus sp. SDUM040013]|uniref:Uncharacterized protein n=1 Tax=Gilvimarinus gilvus TaxID=3058038 RepID=A0ABU4S3Z2_9GAMM|nr:hypothetical protein [Gilvimarinus sp. SDUM040013]MDO3385889.1 hypothetical protein [Gilvimarinus sp. SDUM040013]MDX6850608.1 hypothetical protein [Gilvimarinus sp. SDUM040013]